MDLEAISPEELGRRMQGIGVNLICRDLRGMVDFLIGVFGMQAQQQGREFALMTHQGMILQLHADSAFANHPLGATLSASEPRGNGVQIYVFDSDPDAVAACADSFGGVLIEAAAAKPHGLREATVLGPEGYAFTAARALARS